MKLHAWHFLPHRVIGAAYQMLAGWRLCRRFKAPFWRHIPVSVPCMTTAWNFSSTVQRKDLKRPATILDIGANVSQMTRLLAFSCEPRVVIHSFEPNKTLKPLGECHYLAVSDRDGEAEFRTPAGETMWGTVSDPGSTSNGQVAAVKVRMARIDSLAESGELNWEQLPRPILAKVDTEGGEMAALKGFGELLKDVDYLIIEVGNWSERGENYSLVDMCCFLGEAGFRNSAILFSCFEGTETPSYGDVLFWRNSVASV